MKTTLPPPCHQKPGYTPASSISVPVYGTSFLVCVFGNDLWYVCHGHNSSTHCLTSFKFWLWTSHTRSNSWVLNITYKVKQLGCEHHIQGHTVGLWTSHTRSNSWVVNITYKVTQLGCEHHIQGQPVGLWTSTRSHSWVWKRQDLTGFQSSWTW